MSGQYHGLWKHRPEQPWQNALGMHGIPQSPPGELSSLFCSLSCLDLITEERLLGVHVPLTPVPSPATPFKAKGGLQQGTLNWDGILGGVGATRVCVLLFMAHEAGFPFTVII